MSCCSPGGARSGSCGWRPATATRGPAEILALAADLRVPVQEVSRKRLDSEARSEAPQGVLARAAPLQETDLDDLVKPGRGPAASRSWCSSTG